MEKNNLKLKSALEQLGRKDWLIHRRHLRNNGLVG